MLILILILIVILKDLPTTGYALSLHCTVLYCTVLYRTVLYGFRTNHCTVRMKQLRVNMTV